MIDNYPQSFSSNLKTFTPLSDLLQSHSFNGLLTTGLSLTTEAIDIVEALLDANANVDEPTHHQACLPLLMSCLLANVKLVTRIASRTSYINQPFSVILIESSSGSLSIIFSK
jgi:hypothetical protein